MPRVLMTTSTLPRWANDPEARFVLDLARHLPPSWEATLLAPAAPGAAAHEVLDGVQVIRYRYAPLAAWETLCYPGSIIGRLESNPLRWGLVPGLLSGLRRALAAQLRTGAYSLVHAHWLFPQGLVQGLLPAPQPPAVITSHGGDLGLARRWPVLRGPLRLALRQARALTLVAPGMREVVAELVPDYDTSRMQIIPMGADTERIRPDLRVAALQALRGLARPVVLFVGRLVEKKGLQVLLDAFARPPLSGLDASLVIVGNGPAARVLEAQAMRLVLGGRVRFLGAIGHELLPTLYASSDICCVPSVAAANGDLDGMPTVLPEAAAAGLPLVGSDLAGIPLLVRDGETGLLVPSGDAAALSAALATLVRDADLRTRLGAGARAAVAEFAWPGIAARFANVYAEAIEQSRWRQEH